MLKNWCFILNASQPILSLELIKCEVDSCGDSGFCTVVIHPYNMSPILTCTCSNGTIFYGEVDCGSCKFLNITMFYQLTRNF